MARNTLSDDAFSTSHAAIADCHSTESGVALLVGPMLVVCGHPQDYMRLD